MVEVLKKNNHVIYCDFDHYFINKFYTFTTGDPPFAVCQGHTVKPQKPTANPLPCVAHGKAHTATRHRQSRPLPCAIYRAHGKWFAVCNSRPTAKKKSQPRNDDVVRPLPCALRCGTRQSSNLCRVPWFLHTAKVGMVLAHGKGARTNFFV